MTTPLTRMLPLLLASSALAADLGPGDTSRVLTHDGLDRTYLVHVPPSYDGKHAIPVVLSFHGGGANAQVQVRFSGLDEKGDEAGFAVITPNGTGRLEGMRTWNGGNCCLYAMLNDVDDVGFTAAVLDDVEKVLKVDTKRVYATGISNGAIMCYRLACQLSDRIAAIAPISGTLGFPDCRPSRPVPVIHFHGTADRFVKYEGGSGDRSRTRTLFDSVPHTIATWVKLDGCPEKPVHVELPDRVDDGTTVSKDTYGPGKDGSEVVLVTIEGGGHTWPGRDSRASRILGVSTKDISANDLMWNFFKTHPMP